MESPDELRRAAVDAAASDTDEIIDLTDIVERGEIPAENGFRKDNTDTGLELEKSEDLSLDALIADLRSDQSAAPSNAAREFDLDSLLDGVVSQEERAKGDSARQENARKDERGALASDDEKAIADNDEFDALLQDIVGEIEPAPGSPSDGEEEEIGLDDLDSLLTSLREGPPESVSAASPGKESGEALARDGETSFDSPLSSPSDTQDSADLSLDELDNLLDSLEIPEMGSPLSHADEMISEPVDAQGEQTAMASSRAAGKSEPVFDPSYDENSQGMEGGLEDLDQLLDSLMANEPKKELLTAEPAGEMPRSASTAAPKEMKESFSDSERIRAVPEKRKEAFVRKSDELNVDGVVRELAALKSTCEASLADAGARMTALEALLREEQKKLSRISALTERLDAMDSRLKELGQALASEKSEAEPNEEAIRALVGQELMSEGHMPPYAAALAERLDAMDSRLKELGQALASEKSEAEPDEEAIRALVAQELMSEGPMPPYAAALAERLDAVDSRLEELGQALASEKSEAEPDEEAIRALVGQELMSEGHMPPYATALTERLDAVDSRLEELGQALASEKSEAEPNEEAIRALVGQELMSEGHMPPYATALTERLDAVDSRLEELGQALASEKSEAEPDEEAIRALVAQELMSEGHMPPYATALTERLDAVDSRLEELGQALASEKSGAEPNEEAIRMLVVRELMSESNTPPYVEGMVNELVNFENRIIALENRLEKQESASEKAAAEAAARVIREEMSAMLAEFGQSE